MCIGIKGLGIKIAEGLVVSVHVGPIVGKPMGRESHLRIVWYRHMPLELGEVEGPWDILQCGLKAGRVSKQIIQIRPFRKVAKWV